MHTHKYYSGISIININTSQQKWYAGMQRQQRLCACLCVCVYGMYVYAWGGCNKCFSVTPQRRIDPILLMVPTCPGRARWRDQRTTDSASVCQRTRETKPFQCHYHFVNLTHRHRLPLSAKELRTCTLRSPVTMSTVSEAHEFYYVHLQQQGSVTCE